VVDRCRLSSMVGSGHAVGTGAACCAIPYQIRRHGMNMIKQLRTSGPFCDLRAVRGTPNFRQIRTRSRISGIITDTIEIPRSE
jgi:hypothetical protein